MGFFDDKKYLVNVGLRDERDRQLIVYVKKEIIASSWMEVVNVIKKEYGNRYHSVSPISESKLTEGSQKSSIPAKQKSTSNEIPKSVRQFFSLFSLMLISFNGQIFFPIFTLAACLAYQVIHLTFNVMNPLPVGEMTPFFLFVFILFVIGTMRRKRAMGSNSFFKTIKSGFVQGWKEGMEILNPD